jgi:hypothetical protein
MFLFLDDSILLDGQQSYKNEHEPQLVPRNYHQICRSPTVTPCIGLISRVEVVLSSAHQCRVECCHVGVVVAKVGLPALRCLKGGICPWAELHCGRPTSSQQLTASFGDVIKISISN